VDNGSLGAELAQRLEPDIAKAPPPSLKIEATENGQDVTAYIDSKLSAETSFDDALAFLERTMDDVTSHNLISTAFKHVGGTLTS